MPVAALTLPTKATELLGVALKDAAALPANRRNQEPSILGLVHFRRLLAG
jgi:hypothetical protein